MNQIADCLSQTYALGSACAASCWDGLKSTVNRRNSARFRSGTDSEDDDVMISTASTPLLTLRKPGLQEELTMSPIEKFIKYRRIPFKLIVNVAVVCLITAYMVNDNLQ